jgi:hypothetical protein
MAPQYISQEINPLVPPSSVLRPVQSPTGGRIGAEAAERSDASLMFDTLTMLSKGNIRQYQYRKSITILRGAN